MVLGNPLTSEGTLESLIPIFPWPHSYLPPSGIIYGPTQTVFGNPGALREGPDWLSTKLWSVFIQII